MTALEPETSLAHHLSINRDRVPKGFAHDRPIIMAWDNIDFLEGTKSGHGTTHHTNGFSPDRLQSINDKCLNCIIFAVPSRISFSNYFLCSSSGTSLFNCIILVATSKTSLFNRIIFEVPLRKGICNYHLSCSFKTSSLLYHLCGPFGGNIFDYHLCGSSRTSPSSSIILIFCVYDFSTIHVCVIGQF